MKYYNRVKVAIIGSGIAGIATAIRLAAKGHEVSVFEKNSFPGGKLSEFQLGDYRFDAGPSLFTYPELVEELFQVAGEGMEKYFQYVELQDICNYFYEDGTKFTARKDRKLFAAEISRSTHEPEANIYRALDRSAQLYQYLGEMFMFRSLHDWKTFFSKPALKSYLNLHKLDFFRTMHQANESNFQDPRLIQFFNRYATYNGSNPYETPATMNIIPHLEFGKGAFFPREGMYSITRSLTSLAERQGVSFHYDSQIERIEVTGDQVQGLKVKGTVEYFDRVVSNMDIVGTYKRLLPEIKAPRFLLNQPKSSSALIFYWGIRDSFPELGLHNILFSEDYREEFEDIFGRKSINEDPTIYINISSKLNPSDAPVGSENWFVMINTPNNTGQNWDDLIQRARINILKKLERMLGRSVDVLIEEEHWLDPRSIESRTSSAQGSLYGNSSNNKFAAFLRHPNFSRKIKGLYFCGGSVHPGGGIPMALSSAKIVDRYFR